MPKSDFIDIFLLMFNFNKKKTVYFYALFLLGGILLGLILGKYANYYKNEKLIQSQPIREASQSFKLINPLLACELSEKLELKEIRPLSDKIKNLEKISRKDLIEEASVYVRDLKTGRWAEVNTDLKFSPASLMKIPLMIAVLKYAEIHPDIFSKKIQFGYKYKDENERESEKPAQSLERGQFYEVEELLYRMIVYSDNNAASLLFDSIDHRYFDEVFKDLRIDIPLAEIQTTGDYMDTKSFSLFLRILYNSTYLSRFLSDKALNLLTLSDYKKGLVGGMPSNIILAHKFGENVLGPNDENQIRELHDCGIVYLPAHPYLLCIMTKGKSWTKLQEFIKSMSKLVYEEMVNN